MSVTDDAIDLYNASWMGLRFEPTSNAAAELGKELHRLIFPATETVGPGRPANHEGRKAALLAVIADVLLATRKDPERLVYRKYSRCSFTGEPVSYRNFRVIEEALVKYGYLIKHPGSRVWDNDEASFGHPSAYGRATRWGGTAKLFDLCQQFQITPQAISQNFRALLPDVVVEVKTRYVRDGRHRTGGVVLSYPKTNRSDEIESQVREINEFLRNREIAGTVFLGFQRKFNNVEDIASYRWNQGGRLYSVNYADSYQCQPSAERVKMTIDGHAVVEIDISSSQLRAFHGLQRKPFGSNTGDPYALENVPREIAKAWFVIAIGLGRFPIMWSPEVAAEYRADTGGKELGSKHPIRDVQAAFIKKHPAIGKLPISGLDSLDLSYVESEAVIAAMLELLRHHDVASLPVHDSLIVAEQHEELAMQVLSDCYKAKVGIEPAFTVKRDN